MGETSKREVDQVLLPAVVLLSGGLDSTTVLAMAKAEGYIPHALSFDYGQRHNVELQAAKAVGRYFEVKSHVVLKIDLRAFGGSALTSDIEVPHLSSGQIPTDQIPITYVPARNTVFLSFALAFAEVLGSTDIFIGVNALDYSGYPDCRPEFIDAFEKMANLATKAQIEGAKMSIHSPLISMTKSAIIEAGIALGVDYSMTFSCYDPDANGIACGTCDSCYLRLKAFDTLGMVDPATTA